MTITMNENIQELDAEKMERVVGGVYGFESTHFEGKPDCPFPRLSEHETGLGPSRCPARGTRLEQAGPRSDAD